MVSVSVSIVTSTYKRAHIIERAIRSILKQSFGDWELCIVGDCTPDDTEGVIRSMNDPRVRFYNLPEKSPEGAHGALAKNYAINNMAMGHYIAYLDDDDEYCSPHYLKTMLNILQKNTDIPFCYCRTKYRDADTGRCIWGNPFQGRLHQYEPGKLKRYNYINTNGVIHTKALVQQVGGWNPNTFFDDYDLWLRMNEVTDFYYVNKALVTTYIRGELPFWRRAVKKGMFLMKHGRRMPLPYDGDYFRRR
jgi:glycosyltransferase involved in cell wall biosynthesis